MPVKKKQGSGGSVFGSSLKSSVSSPKTMKSSSEHMAVDEEKNSEPLPSKPKVNEAFREMIMREAKKRKKELKQAKKTGGEAWEKFKSKLVLHATPQEFKSRSARARVAMPVDKLRKRVHEICPANIRVPTEAGVALAAALDYGVSELLEVACKVAEMKQQRTITPRHIKLGVPQDESLAELFRGVTIPQGGTVPTVHPELAQGYRKRNSSRRDDDSSTRVPTTRTVNSSTRFTKRMRGSGSPGHDSPHKKEESSPSESSSKRPGGDISPNDATDKDETSPIASDRQSDKDAGGASSKGELKSASSPFQSFDPKDGKDGASPKDMSEKKDPSSPSTPKDGNTETPDGKDDAD